jgi:hypothetical protein
MGLFHRHTWSTFTCNAQEIEGIKLINAKDITTKEVFFLGDLSLHRCPTHPNDSLRSDGECRSCFYRIKLTPMPKLNEVLITYKNCLTCGVYDITVQCGKFNYTVNKEYIKLKIQQIKKEKEDAETERLLNLGNPDYKPSKSDSEKIKEYEKIIEEQKQSISHLQTYLRTTLSRLNSSLKNDGIWEAIPPKVRRDLIAKYGDKASTYEPISVDDIAKFCNAK